MNPITFVIFGATGDLTRRKLIPALYHILAAQKIDLFTIVLAAHDAVSVAECFQKALPFMHNPDMILWQKLQNNAVIFTINLEDQKQFEGLHLFLEQKEQQYNKPCNRLFYLAVPSFLFASITDGLGSSKAAIRDTLPHQWHRIVYEKPFGNSSENAALINQAIAHYFNESQIYRVDHYLTKELVSSIVLVRFTNMIFEPLWNNQFIEEVQIIMNESITVASHYYDQYGVLKDVVQNHALQLLSLVGMELPTALRDDYIRDQKAHVIAATHIDDIILGQYTGYNKEMHLTESTTPTFAAIKLGINTHRWRGVPFYIKAGKALSKKETSIHIKFKEVPCKLRAQCQYSSNYLHIRIDPHPTFSIELNTKEPKSLYEVMPVSLLFNHDYMQNTTSPEAYETLFSHVIHGDQSVAVRADEIMHAWNLIEKVHNEDHPLYRYEQKSNGPEAIKLFNQKHKLRWCT